MLDEIEPPVSIRFSDTGSQLSFPDDSPRVNENATLITVVGKVIARDQDSGTLTLSLDEDAGGLFQLTTPSTCAVSVSICFTATQHHFLCRSLAGRFYCLLRKRHCGRLA